MLPRSTRAARCIPSYPANAPNFLDSQIAACSRSRATTAPPSSAPVPAPLPAISSPTSVADYAYIASPINPGQTGVRGFGGDASGLLCFNPDGNTRARCRHHGHGRPVDGRRHLRGPAVAFGLTRAA